MNAIDPERMRDALDLLVGQAEQEVARARARINGLVASIAADTQAIVEQHKADGAGGVDATWIAMHARDLVAAQAALSDRRERLRDLESLIEFASPRAPTSGGR